MRSIRLPLLIVASLLAVVIGVAAAFVSGRDKGEPAQPAAVATPTTSAAGQPVGATPQPNDTPKPSDQAASAAAVAFMRELGMRDPVAASFRSTGDATAEVGIHPRAGEGGRPLDKVTTLVQLRRYTGGWVVTGAKATNAIEVDEPLAFTRVLSPLTVSGLSSAFEGTVHVTVTEDRRGADRVLGRGFVNGGATEPAPFRGPISFRRPSADAGWVVFSGDTGADTGIIFVAGRVPDLPGTAAHDSGTLPHARVPACCSPRRGSDAEPAGFVGGPFEAHELASRKVTANAAA